MFEMLGNFSFGDYFKDGAIDFAWEFVTEHMQLDPDRLWATVFAGDPALGLGEDEVAVKGWLRKGIPRERIVALPRSENFWGPPARPGRAAPAPSCIYDRGQEHGCGEPDCAPGCERCDRYIEFWNLVFMEFDLARRRLADAAAEAEHRHGAGPRARRHAPAGRRLDLRHGRLPADHGLDRARSRVSATAPRARRRRRTGCSPITAAG